MNTLKIDMPTLYKKVNKVIEDSTELNDGIPVLSLDGGTEDLTNYPEIFSEISNSLEEVRNIMSSYRTNKATTKDLGALQTDTRKEIAQVLANLNPNITAAKDAARSGGKVG